ncbi:hypothetical protein NDU88_004733 [Pleurodeles waltl]|uniref:Uncharacterized protein n=1 Tax=Pleurodeles waltl TaxID=8319 RepID=A0AAV7TUH2_PLEWA|nr:hypothetical protein NDU88_007377 [Pleurodeles waltl]KAJ1154635.1 hypothetical protein NDU88_007378 [Pleurodeles waltl]KAJ1179499.1 hypothetical protein NDU88_004733 [Pleurodeles waltl]
MRGFRLWRSGRNLPARAPPLHSPAFMPAPRLSWGARDYGNQIEARNAKRPALALARIHAGAPAQPGRPPLRQSYRGQKHKEARGGD